MPARLRQAGQDRADEPLVSGDEQANGEGSGCGGFALWRLAESCAVGAGWGIG
jgi:hypothetical protein